MSVDPISHSRPLRANNPQNDSSKKINVGDFESDSGLREAIHALPAKEMGYAHLLLKDFGQAVRKQDYAQAQEIYSSIGTQYGSLTSPLLDVMYNKLDPDVIAEIV